jgi:hypothetical protein
MFWVAVSTSDGHIVGNLGYVQSPGSYLAPDSQGLGDIANIGLSDVDVNRQSLNWHFGLPEI